jgi:hypothetical protein
MFFASASPGLELMLFRRPRVRWLTSLPDLLTTSLMCVVGFTLTVAYEALRFRARSATPSASDRSSAHRDT